MADSMIDLGKTPGGEAKVATSDAKKVFYPTIHLTDIPELDELPDGEFEFTGRACVVAHSESKRDGKRTCSCEIEIRAIDPNVESEADESDDSPEEDSLEKGLDSKLTEMEAKDSE